MRVVIDIVVLGVGQVDEINMEFRSDILLTQSWTDSRLANDHLTEIEVPRHLMAGIWVPDTYFVNAKRANGHDVTVANRYEVYVRFCICLMYVCAEEFHISRTFH